MAGFQFKLDTADGKPAGPSQLSSAVPNWSPGYMIHFADKTLRVVPCTTTMPICRQC
jgi:hypothetical protein